MDIRLGSQQGATVNGIGLVLIEIQKRLQRHPGEWLQSLQEDPGSFANLERTVHVTFQQMADQLVAGLLAQATQGDDFAQSAKKK
jgi:hypothetical protein